MRNFFFVVGVFCTTVLSATIVTTRTVEPIKEAVDRLDQNSLVLFDIDQVLLTRSDMIFQQGVHEQVKRLYDRFLATHSKDEVKRLDSIVWMQSPEQIVDQKMLILIREIQQRKIPVMALTKAGSGRYGCIASFEEYRADALKKFGFDFSSSFFGMRKKSFDEFKVSHPPVFTRGVLCTGRVGKGEALRAFLQYINFSPKRILFVDDLLENISDVEKVCEEKHIGFEGFVYTEVQERPVPTFHQELVDFQIAVLEKEGRWLPDHEALLRMGRGTGL